LDTSHRSEDEACTDTAVDASRDRFFALLRAALAERTFGRLVLSKPLAGDGAPVRVAVREIELRGARGLSFVHSHPTRDVTQNLSFEDGVAALERFVGDGFGHAHLFTATQEIQLRLGKKGRYGLSRSKLQSAQVQVQVPESASAPESALESASAKTQLQATKPAPHDRAKRRYVDITRPWLFDLGITDAQGRLIPAMARKWKQINKFVEVFDHAWAAAPRRAEAGPVRVVDFGSGKGYLTFAIHDHLRRTLGVEAVVAGVELRADLAALCNRAARRSALDGLAFVQGDLRTQAPAAIDVMIALHACDTATDHALHLGVQAGAAVMLCAPCCHKQLRPQMHSPGVLRPMLQHGVHMGQQAEMVTDSLRALLLEAEGYATQVFEFVALEHTSKNKMILAVRRERGAPDRAAVQRQIGEIKSFYGVAEHCLETLLVAGTA
ncbi:MAG: class I SAM-dependent methyltransferase, partial [Caldimonas sp.]